MMYKRIFLKSALSLLFCVFLLWLAQSPAFAHVKWFSDFSFSDQPLTIGQAFDSTFILLALLSMVVIGAMVYLDRRLAKANGTTA